MPKVVKVDNIDYLVERYAAGESLYAISRSTGVDRSALGRRFAAAGVALRGMSAAQTVRSSRTPVDVKRAQVSKANVAARGRSMSLGEKLKRSASRSRRVGKYEAEIVEELRRRGIECDHQFPLGVYNIDIWLSEARIAVEIYRAHPGRELMTRIHKRTEHILNGGASQATIQVGYPKGSLHLGPVCDQLIAFADFCRRHHPSGGQHAVIRGHGKLAPTSSHETNGRPLVVRLDAGDEPA